MDETDLRAIAELLRWLSMGAHCAAGESRDHGHEAQACTFADAAKAATDIRDTILEGLHTWKIPSAILADIADGEAYYLPHDGTLR